MIRAIAVLVAISIPFPAHAFPCWMIKRAVAQYGEAAVESWARAKGISDKEIEKARRCVR
jgi:hypothetical protein